MELKAKYKWANRKILEHSTEENPDNLGLDYSVFFSILKCSTEDMIHVIN